MNWQATCSLQPPCFETPATDTEGKIYCMVVRLPCAQLWLSYFRSYFISALAVWILQNVIYCYVRTVYSCMKQCNHCIIIMYSIIIYSSLGRCQHCYALIAQCCNITIKNSVIHNISQGMTWFCRYNTLVCSECLWHWVSENDFWY